MLVLKFNAEQMAHDLCDALVYAADEIIKMFMNDVGSDLKANDFEDKGAIFDYAAQRIIAECAFYAESILESYGRGSLMDEENPSLADYMSSAFWNPERQTTTIVGRPAGGYTNIFGEQAYSKGTMEGLYMEHIVAPIQPSYAIQNAEKRLNLIFKGQGYATRTLERYTEDFFNTMNAMKYFYNEEVNG